MTGLRAGVLKEQYEEDEGERRTLEGNRTKRLLQRAMGYWGSIGRARGLDWIDYGWVGLDFIQKRDFRLDSNEANNVRYLL